MKNKIVKPLLGLVGIAILIFAFSIIKDLRQEKFLKDTINNYIKDQTIPKESKTTGEYHKIEKVIIEYLENTNNQTDELKSIFNDIYSFEFYEATVVANSVKENFKSDETKLNELEAKLVLKLDEIIELNDYETLLSKFKSEDDYYNDLYIELLGDKKGLEDAIKLYKEFKENYTAYFKVGHKYLDFLKGSTVIVDTEKKLLMFENTSEIDEYNNIVEELNQSLATLVHDKI